MKFGGSDMAAAHTSSNSSLGLHSARDVQKRESTYKALSHEPWLRIDFHGRLPAGRWIELCYKTSLLEPLARPVLRCFLENAFHDEILPGALFGRAIWTGYIPKGTKEIWISPTNHAGAFSFGIERYVALSHPRAMWRAFRQNTSHCLLGLGAQLIGLQHFAKVELKRALSITSFAAYNAWRQVRSRELDFTHFDMPEADWAHGPHIRFTAFREGTALQDGAAAAHLIRLVSELENQPYPNWSLVIVSSTNIDLSLFQGRAVREKLSLSSQHRLGTGLYDGLSAADFIAPIDLSDSLPFYALPVLAEASNREPETDIFYGDEEFINESGQYFSPLLRPDWSSAIGTIPIGTAKFFRTGFLKEQTLGAVELLRPAETITIDEAMLRADVTHIRRVMRTRRGQTPVYSHRLKADDMKTTPANMGLGPRPRASLIIPTKDRFDLLSRCIESLEKKTCLDGIEIIIVDNGTTQRDARHFLDRLADLPHFRVISRLGPFNFARFCNDAAAEASAPILVFLNNDTEIIEDGWLDSLLFWVQKSNAGAVGAKLLYPNGRLQHAGVVLGLGGRAGHFERTLQRDDAGYLGQLNIPHEVSSVTAACLAVDKRKFDAVGGFDAVHLPVELNDIDLCLRLAERGWKTIFVPDSVLIHRESASRGAVLHPDKTYGQEHAYFCKRWIHRLRDDPFFHPALSLHAHYPALE